MNWWQKLKLIDKVVGVWKILVSNSTEFILLRIARRWSKWWGDLWNFLRVWKMRFFFRSYLNVVDFMTVRRWDVVDSSYLIINNFMLQCIKRFKRLFFPRLDLNVLSPVSSQNLSWGTWSGSGENRDEWLEKMFLVLASFAKAF